MSSRLFLPCLLAWASISGSAMGQLLRELPLRPTSFSQVNIFGVELVDLDADGDLDLFIGGRGKRSFVGINDGRGRFEDQASSRLPAEGYNVCGALAFADVDGDGDVDCYFGNYDYYESRRDKDRLLINDGNGYFSLSPHAFPNLASPNDAVFADVDRDGDPDLLLSSYPYGPNGLMLYLNDGTGKFTDVTIQRLPAAPKGLNTIAVADLDRDGWLDIVFGNDTTEPRVLMNNGGGYFRDDTALRFPWIANGLHIVRTADVDGDGDADVLVAGIVDFQWSFRARLFINDGRGYFSEETSKRLPVDSDACTDARFCDLDGDGDLDLVLCNAVIWLQSGGPGASKIYENDGTGHFSDVTASWLSLHPAPYFSYRVRTGDIDGDGDEDLLFAGRGVSGPSGKFDFLFYNHTRQLSAPQNAVAGTTWNLQLAGPAHSVNWLLLGFTPATLPTPFGLLGVDPLTAVLWPVPIVLPSSGDATVPIPLPTHAKGIRLFVQAAQLDLASFSETRFTNTWEDVVQ